MHRVLTGWCCVVYSNYPCACVPQLDMWHCVCKLELWSTKEAWNGQGVLKSKVLPWGLFSCLCGWMKKKYRDIHSRQGKNWGQVQNRCLDLWLSLSRFVLNVIYLCVSPTFYSVICSNTIQFTHTQIEAIRAGMQPGLTMVRESLLQVLLHGLKLEISTRVFKHKTKFRYL